MLARAASGQSLRHYVRAAWTRAGQIPAQSWPLAYWPDGSLKWTAHAFGAGARGPASSRTPASSSASRPRAARCSEGRDAPRAPQIPAAGPRRQPAACSLQGPFERPGAPVTPAGLWSEGPPAPQVGGDVIVHYDAYAMKHDGALRSRGLVHWEDVTAHMRFPDEGTPRRMRHGTAPRVPPDVPAAWRARRIRKPSRLLRGNGARKVCRME